MPVYDIFSKIDIISIDDDLLSVNNIINTTSELDTWVWWHSILNSNIALPWAMSMCCAVRVSRKLLTIVGEHVALHKNSDKFHEFIFHTLSLHNHLIVSKIKNLEGIVHRKNWTKEEMNNETLYHPVKSMSQQVDFRSYLLEK